MTGKTRCFLLGLVLGAVRLGWASDVPPAPVQIASAVLAAPEELRAGAAILGYNSEGKLVTLREGNNELICLASDPKQNSFSVACYHRELEPYMARGRELSAQKMSGKERNDVRWKEIAEGKLSMPREPRMLYVLTGSRYDAAGGKVIDSYLRWVLYTPYATAKSTGLSTKPVENAPWLMYPGTAGAHIMISPAKK